MLPQATFTKADSRPLDVLCAIPWGLGVGSSVTGCWMSLKDWITVLKRQSTTFNRCNTFNDGGWHLLHHRSSTCGVGVRSLHQRGWLFHLGVGFKVGCRVGVQGLEFRPSYP